MLLQILFFIRTIVIIFLKLHYSRVTLHVQDFPVGLVQCDEAYVQIEDPVVQSEQFVAILALTASKRPDVVKILSKLLHFEPRDHI